jgi:hypothetical protein
VEYLSLSLSRSFGLTPYRSRSASRANLAHADRVADGTTVTGDNVPEELIVKCPSCEGDIRAADETRLVDGLQGPLSIRIRSR